MRYPTIPYMEWVKTVPDFSNPDMVNLATSGMPMLARSWGELGIHPAEIPLGFGGGYGYAPLLESIAQRYGVKPENVFTAQGASMANYMLFAVALERGETLLVESPVYECLDHAAMGLDLRVVYFQRRPEEGWALEVERIAELAVQEKARAVLLTNPHNPTGAFTGDDELAALANSLGEERLLLVDEIYREWLPGQARKTVALQRPNIVITSSLTKVWGLSDLRAGWMIADEELVQRAWRAYDHMGVKEPFHVDWMLHQLFSSPEALSGLLARARDRIDQNLAKVEAFLNTPPASSLEVALPPSGGFGFLRHQELDGDEVYRALEGRGVYVTPGRFFRAKGWFRLAWTLPPDALEEGLARLAFWLG